VFVYTPVPPMNHSRKPRLSHRASFEVWCAQLLTVLVLGSGCTKDPVEHFSPPSSGPTEDTSDDKSDGSSSSDKRTSEDSTSSAVAPVTSGGDAGETRVTRDAGETSDVTSTDPDAGSTPGRVSFAQRTQAAIDDECLAAPHGSPTFSRKALRTAASECAMWHYCGFGVVARELNGVVQSYKSEPNAETLEEAQAAWRFAMEYWSRVELFQFGPLGSQSQSAGKDMYEGRGIRELVYAWPTTSACRVDEQLVSETYASRGMQNVLISGRGLFALEYLLFGTEATSACLATTQTAQQWAKLSSSERAKRKRNYAAAVSADIAQQMNTLNELWSPSGGNFKAVLVDAGGKYPDEQEAMKAIAWSMIYIERELKDWKLGIPAGYTLTHPVTNPETPYAELGIDNVRANLRGFRSLFQGCGPDGEGLGFDDWLSAAGHSELADDMVAALNVAQKAADDYTASLNDKSPALESLYQAIRGLTSLLKSDFFGAGSPIGLELPGGVEGDTD
jgi:predicted lipoprotein